MLSAVLESALKKHLILTNTDAHSALSPILDTQHLLSGSSMFKSSDGRFLDELLAENPGLFLDGTQ